MSKLISLIALVFLVGCGIQKVTEQTRDGVSESNRKQEQLIQEVRQLQEDMRKLRQSMLDLVSGMNLTGDKMHENNLKQALDGLVSSYATELLFPPIRMMPYAIAFGGEARPDELIRIFQLLFTEAQIGFDSSAKGDKRIAARKIALTAAGLIAAYAPESKVREIVVTHIEKHGELEDYGLAFQTCRFTFMRDFLLKAIFARGKLNLTLLKLSEGYISSLTNIAKHAALKEFRFLIKQFVPEKDEKFSNFEDSVDPTQIPDLAHSVVDVFTNPGTGMSAEELKLPETQEIFKRLQAM